MIKSPNGDVVPKTAHVAPVNNTLHSLFSQLDVSLNDVPILSSTTTYPYRASIENHLNYGNDAKESRLSAGLYYMDDNIEVSDPIPDDEDAIVNSGLQAWHGVCTGQTFDMIGGLQADIFNQNCYMINRVTMKLRMTRSKDCFVLMSADAESYTVDIVSAKLPIWKLKIAPSLGLAHEKFNG